MQHSYRNDTLSERFQESVRRDRTLIYSKYIKNLLLTLRLGAKKRQRDLEVTDNEDDLYSQISGTNRASSLQRSSRSSSRASSTARRGSTNR
jgi:hypothetical protein